MRVGLTQLVEDLKRKDWSSLRREEFCIQTASELKMQHLVLLEFLVLWPASKILDLPAPAFT